MPDVLAKTMAVVCGFLLVAAAAILYVTSRPAAGAQQVTVEFQDAFPLLEGMYVRVDGSIAGSVGPIEVADDGLARVTLILDDAIEEPSSDASAAIRQQDTTGDSYISFDPGDSGEALPEVDGEPTIECAAEGPDDPCAQSLSAPRFDDLLNSFGPAERSGLKLVLVELSKALDQRGDDVNAAALELRPAMVAANEAFAEVAEQNEALKAVIEDAEDVTGQAASKRAELAALIDGLETTLAATNESSSLDAGLERLPETTAQARSTMSSLAGAAEASIPLAEDVGLAAPQLADAIDATPGFLDDSSAAIDDATPTLDLTRKLLRAGEPTIRADPTRVVTGPFDLAPAVSNLLTGVLGDASTIKALFGDDSGGVGEGTLDGFGLGAVTVEPGNQPGYPASNENRNMFRISAVFNCTMFGVPVEPGCLTDILSPRRAKSRDASAGASGSGDSGGGEPPAPEPPEIPDILPGVETPNTGLDDINKLLDDVGGQLGLKGGKGKPGGGKAGKPMEDLLDFLFTP